MPNSEIITLVLCAQATVKSNHTP